MPLLTVVVGALLTVRTEHFLSWGNLVNVLTEMSTLALLAFGATLVMVGGAFDLSIGSQLALHGVVAAIVMAATGSIACGVLAALVSGLVFGLANGHMVTHLALNPLIATLASMLFCRGAALAITGGAPVTGLPNGIDGFGANGILGLPWPVWLMAGGFVVAAYLLHATPFGLQVKSTGGNREAARLAGVPVTRITIATFAFSGVFAAVAGIATTLRLQSGQPTAGELSELFALAAVVVGGTSIYGGIGSLWGTLAGVTLLAIIDNGLTLLSVSSAYEMMIVGLLLVLAASSQGMWRRKIDASDR